MNLTSKIPSSHAAIIIKRQAHVQCPFVAAKTRGRTNGSYGHGTGAVDDGVVRPNQIIVFMYVVKHECSASPLVENVKCLLYCVANDDALCKGGILRNAYSIPVQRANNNDDNACNATNQKGYAGDANRT